MNKQRGFTLIELMIVVVIIGILAALALPAYSDYTAKSKVSEVGNVTAAARTAITVAFNEGTLAADADNAKLGLTTSDAIASKYVASVEAKGLSPQQATVTATMANTGKTAIDGKTIVYTIDCNEGGCRTSIGGTVDAKFLPKT